MKFVKLLSCLVALVVSVAALESFAQTQLPGRVVGQAEAGCLKGGDCCTANANHTCGDGAGCTGADPCVSGCGNGGGSDNPTGITCTENPLTCRISQNVGTCSG